MAVLEVVQQGKGCARSGESFQMLKLHCCNSNGNSSYSILISGRAGYGHLCLCLGEVSHQIKLLRVTSQQPLGVLAKLLVGFEYSPRSSGVNVTQSSAFRLEMAELGWHLAELMVSTPCQRCGGSRSIWRSSRRGREKKGGASSGTRGRRGAKSD